MIHFDSDSISLVWATFLAPIVVNCVALLYVILACGPRDMSKVIRAVTPYTFAMVMAIGVFIIGGVSAIDDVAGTVGWVIYGSGAVVGITGVIYTSILAVSLIKILLESPEDDEDDNDDGDDLPDPRPFSPSPSGQRVSPDLQTCSSPGLSQARRFALQISPKG